MRFYWEGYAEVIHLATTARCLPKPAATHRATPHCRSASRLHCLWRSVRGRLRRLPAS